MKRNWMIFGCAALLALGLSFGSFAGSITDTDGDGVPDSFDNCVVRDNGPLQSTGACNGQEDANLDGYGQPCDFDYNNNGQPDASDLAGMLGVLGNPAATAQDNNCNGAPDAGDLAALLGQLGVPVSGQSGLACAGTVPCVAQ